MVNNFENANGNGFRGVMGDGCLHGGRGTRTTEGQLSLRRMRAALFLGCRFATDRGALAFYLLRCCCVALPCPLTPGEQTGQRPSPLLKLTLCSCHCPQSLVDRYPRSSGSSVMLWATSGSPGTQGIERGVIPGPCQGQALCGGHGPDWGRCICPQEPSVHPDHAAADARSKEGGIRVHAR